MAATVRQAASAAAALEAEQLIVRFPASDGRSAAVVDGVSLRLRRGQALGMVGESGSGKTMIALSLLGLVPAPGRVSAAALRLGDIDLRMLNEAQWRELRGCEIAMIFQNPMSGFNPVRSIGHQLARAVLRHSSVDRQTAWQRAVEALHGVDIPAAEQRAHAYPQEMSGGMLQRAMIALALINQPAFVLADEPTTALDATVQAQILELLRARLAGAGLLLVTHNLAVAAQLCDHIAVVYAGRLAELGTSRAVLTRPRHPYTRALVRAAPTLARRVETLESIPGQPPGPADLIDGCRFARRCPWVSSRCREPPPLALMDDVQVACWHAGEKG